MIRIYDIFFNNLYIYQNGTIFLELHIICVLRLKAQKKSPWGTCITPTVNPETRSLIKSPFQLYFGSHCKMGTSLRSEETKLIWAAVNFINIYTHVFRMKFWRQSWNVSRNSCQKGRSYKKFVRKTMMKLTPERLIQEVSFRFAFFKHSFSVWWFALFFFWLHVHLDNLHSLQDFWLILTFLKMKLLLCFWYIFLQILKLFNKW